jgi:hypothetical protein
MLTLNGAPSWIRTSGFTALQAVALDHSAIGAYKLRPTYLARLQMACQTVNSFMNWLRILFCYQLPGLWHQPQ